MFKLVRSEKFYMQIVSQIRGRIEDGSLAAGSRLPTEAALTESFGASRASIREALSALEILGLIEGRSGGKYVRARPGGPGDDGEAVRFLAEDSAFDLFDARVVLEPDIAALAAERASAQEKRAIAAQLTKCEAVQRRAASGAVPLPRAVEEYLEEDRAFHLAIGAAAHNRVLHRCFAAIHSVLHSVHWRLLKRKVSLDAAGMRRLNLEHRAVLAAIQAGNPRQARSVMARHLVDLRDVLF